MNDNGKCAHPACSCAVPKGEKYFSESCEDAGDLTELTCQCDHAGCVGEALKV